MRRARTFAAEIALAQAEAARRPNGPGAAIAAAIEADRKARRKRLSDAFRWHECSDAAADALEALGVTVRV
jgi:hypothetical protein